MCTLITNKHIIMPEENCFSRINIPPQSHKYIYPHTFPPLLNTPPPPYPQPHTHTLTSSSLSLTHTHAYTFSTSTPPRFTPALHCYIHTMAKMFGGIHFSKVSHITVPNLSEFGTWLKFKVVSSESIIFNCVDSSKLLFFQV